MTSLRTPEATCTSPSTATAAAPRACDVTWTGMPPSAPTLKYKVAAAGPALALTLQSVAVVVSSHHPQPHSVRGETSEGRTGGSAPAGTVGVVVV